ncbi:hypothetical protein VFPBJ_11100 [Purpureocillium lilacinum]|uniref:Uncharacterized protein n=1 Tax=Purpureocillium lilacinum TaxID=33203 RepID=A0A179FPG5_PURLI|nr:hypothetical protein VFPBJ_11100 [Purpureocillium lilacinum]
MGANIAAKTGLMDKFDVVEAAVVLKVDDDDEDERSAKSKAATEAHDDAVVPPNLRPQRPSVLGGPTDAVADALLVVEARDEEDEDDEDYDDAKLLLEHVLLELELLELETLELELELPKPHWSYRGWQPVPQWVMVLPHHPAEEQHLSVPWFTHVVPLKLVPQRPLVLVTPRDAVADALAVVHVEVRDGDDVEPELIVMLVLLELELELLVVLLEPLELVELELELELAEPHWP